MSMVRAREWMIGRMTVRANDMLNLKCYLSSGDSSQGLVRKWV